MGQHTYYLKHKDKFQKGKIGLHALIAYMLSSLFSLIVTLKNFAYKKGLLKPEKVDLPVISVGNIAIGGSGKTPFCICLAASLQGRVQCGFISRGYRGELSRRLKKNETLDVCRGHGPLIPAADCGDEPFLIAKACPTLPFVVGKKRAVAARRIATLGAELALMDDGLQHQKLHRDIEIILLPQDDPLGKGAFFPRGELRDSLARLEDADYLVLTNATSAGYDQTKELLKSYSSAPLIGTTSRVTETKGLDGSTWDLRKKRAVAFAGIANPERFKKTLEQHGVQIVAFEAFPDHQLPTEDELRGLHLRAKHIDAECIVCTEKDAVKILGALDLPLPIVQVKIKHVVSYGEAHYNKLLDQIEGLLKIRDRRSPGVDDKQKSVVR